MSVFPKIFERLRQQCADDMMVVAGGVMPDGAMAALKAMGMKEVLLQDTPPQVAVDTRRRLVAERGLR